MPQIQLRTMFLLDEGGRITSTAEGGATSAPPVVLIGSASSSAWTARADVTSEPVAELNQIADGTAEARSSGPPPHAASTFR